MSKKTSVTKTELVQDMSERLNISKKEANNFLDTLTCLVEKYLEKNMSVSLPNLVKFSPQKKPATKAKEMRNPFTGEMMKVSAKPERKIVKAKITKTLKNLYTN